MVYSVRLKSSTSMSLLREMNCICVACSPAQAASAPAVMPDQSATLAAQYGRYAGRGITQDHHAASQLAQSPYVVCEPLKPDVKVHAVSLTIL